MNDKIESDKASDLSTLDDIADCLTNEKEMIAYLNRLLAENDTAKFVHALGVIAKARGMTQIAKDTGIGRESLYKALRDNSSPRFETISRVLNALQLKLVAVPINS